MDRPREAQHGGVIERRADDVDVVVARAGCRTGAGCRPGRWPCSSGSAPDSARRTPLGLPGGARGVVHGVAEAAVVGHGRSSGRRASRRRSRSRRCRPRPGGARPGSRPRRRRRCTSSANRSWPMKTLALGVLDDVGDLGGHQVVVDGDDVPAGLKGGEVDLEDLDAVGQHEGDGVALGPARARRRAWTTWLARPRSSPALSSVPSGATRARWPGSSCAMAQNPKSVIFAPPRRSGGPPATIDPAVAPAVDRWRTIGAWWAVPPPGHPSSNDVGPDARVNTFSLRASPRRC